MNIVEYDNRQERIRQLENEDLSISIHERSQNASVETVQEHDTILIVDDEPEIINAVKRYLQRNGYRVITAENGREAVDQYKRHGIHLVLLDVRLPDMSGLRCLEVIKSINQNAKIMISTGLSTRQEEKKASDLGAIAFLPKPYSLSQLLVTVKKILNGQS